MNNINVINALNEKEPLSEIKVLNSAKRSGANSVLAKEIVKIVLEKAYDGMTTREIYTIIRKELLKKQPQSGMRYSLKEAIRKLGPTGFWFEKYASKIFEVYGYKTKIDQMVKGKCTDYEVDILMHKESVKDFVFGECKYHNEPGTRVNISVILENYASFIDLNQGKIANDFRNKGCKTRKIVITNTKFTSKAIDYANCYGLDLIGWKYPKDKSLAFYIESQQLYPVTILPSCDPMSLKIIYDRNILFAKDFLKPNIEKLFKEENGFEKKLKQLIKEARILFSE